MCCEMLLPMPSDEKILAALMSFELKDVAPWGRSFEEYVSMFALSNDDLHSLILGCGDGPASFNAGLTKRGGHVVSVDPLYRFNTPEIRYLIDESYPTIMEQTRRNLEEFVWTTIPSVNELGRVRMEAMQEFLADYPHGRQQRRYVKGELPKLRFSDGKFELALCSHFLFLYSEKFSEAFHVAAIRELCRVANEVRIFPLLELGAKPSRHLQAVTDLLARDGYKVTFRTVPYEFQRGANRMMRIRAGVGVEQQNRPYQTEFQPPNLPRGGAAKKR